MPWTVKGHRYEQRK